MALFGQTAVSEDMRHKLLNELLELSIQHIRNREAATNFNWGSIRSYWIQTSVYWCL